MKFTWSTDSGIHPYEFLPEAVGSKGSSAKHSTMAGNLVAYLALDFLLIALSSVFDPCFEGFFEKVIFYRTRPRPRLCKGTG